MKKFFEEPTVEVIKFQEAECIMAFEGTSDTYEEDEEEYIDDAEAYDENGYPASSDDNDEGVA